MGVNSTAEGNPIAVVINLDTDQNTRALNFEEIVHPREFNFVIELIEDSLRKITLSGRQQTYNADCLENKRRTEFARFHDTITISGARGTGKTTFILSILRRIKESYCADRYQENPLLSDIEVLEVIDPTLIEEKTHLLINIISKIRYSVTTSASFRNFLSDEEECLRKFRNWEESFNDLAEGLPVLDGIGKDRLTGSEWDDPKYVMNEGVRKAKAANDLERNFHRFVNESLKIIGKKAFLICFDDIDTNFTKGWPVLEVLRKYLTSPRIITLLSGDFELYSAIVRKSQWNNLEIDIIPGETTASLSHYKLLVSQLENQYLLKVLRPERRVTLSSVFANISQYMIEYRINDLDISTYYKQNLFNRYSFRSQEELDTVIGFVENMPIRSQIQLLIAIKENGAENPKTLFNLFWNNWNEWNSNNSVIFNQPEYFPRVVIRFLLDNNLIEDGNQLLPNNSNFSKSASLFIAGLYYQALIRDRSYFIFEYLIRIGLVHEVQEVLDNDASGMEKSDFRIFIEHCRILTQNNLFVISGRYNTIRFTTTKSSKPGAFFEPLGNAELFALFESSKDQRLIRIDTILSDSGNKLNEVIGLLPLTVVSDNRGYGAPKYSIFNLLAVIGELLKMENPNKERVAIFLEKYSQEKSFPRIGTLETTLDTDQPTYIEDTETSDFEELSDREMEDFLSNLLGWLDEAKPSPSPYLLASVSSRFYNNLKVIDDRNFTFVGPWMSFVTCVFLNAVIIEEYFWTIREKTINGIRLTNIGESYRYFLDNLKVVTDHQNEFEFSLWMMKCPLLQIFVDYDVLKQTSRWVEITSFFKPSKDWKLIEVLRSVPIKTKPINLSLTNSKHLKILTEYCINTGITSTAVPNLSAKQITELIKKAFNNNVIIPSGIIIQVRKILRDLLSL